MGNRLSRWARRLLLANPGALGRWWCVYGARRDTNIARLDAACRLQTADCREEMLPHAKGMCVRSLTVASADVRCSHKSCRRSSSCYAISIARGIILYRATESTSAHSGLRLCHGCLPDGRAVSPLHHPESRCFLRLSYHNAIHAAQIAVSPFLRGSSASLRPAAVHSASAAGTA